MNVGGRLLNAIFDGGWIPGGTKVTGSGKISSENFVTGSAGWNIEGTGDAEFNNITARGDVIAANLIAVGGDNRLANGDFETDVSGWTDSGAGVDFEHLAGAGYDGGDVGELTNATGAGATIYVTSEQVAIDPEFIYICEAVLARNTTYGAVAAKLQARCLTSAGTLVGTIEQSLVLTLTTNHYRYAFAFRPSDAGANVALVEVRITAGSSVANGSKLYIDEVRLRAAGAVRAEFASVGITDDEHLLLTGRQIESRDGAGDVSAIKPLLVNWNTLDQPRAGTGIFGRFAVYLALIAKGIALSGSAPATDDQTKGYWTQAGSISTVFTNGVGSLSWPEEWENGVLAATATAVIANPGDPAASGGVARSILTIGSGTSTSVLDLNLYDDTGAGVDGTVTVNFIAIGW